MSIPKEPEQVMKLRGGSVLGKKTILKSDHFPGCQNKRLSPHIDGAPNYRQADSQHVHGVAIPTISGIQNVLNNIGAQHIDGKRAQVLWINLCEEPVVYINGCPFVLHDLERPFSNLEYTGINRARVEQMEARLKEDILIESARYGNKILLTDELPDGQMVDQWEPVSRHSVKTPLEVYEELQEQGYLVAYERELNFDILVHKISQADINAEIIFNRMVIANLIYLNRIGASSIPRTNSIGKISESSEIVADNFPSSEDAIRSGEYAVIRSLIQGGVEGKRQVDKVIDKCASMQVDGYPVYSMATPTIRGAKEMLAYLGAKPKAEGSAAQKVILTDLREVVVYINGTPFVEHMEARLKEDILSEVRQSGGRMLLHREEYSPALNQFSVIGYLESIFADDVKTPAEVYTALKDEEDLPSRASDEEALGMGDYRDILSLTRVLVYGPKSKADVDIVIERCAGAGHLRDDILYYSKELKKFPDAEDEQRAYLMDMGIKALRSEN
ncbi:paladin-like [Pyrus ussuriensis x Pyrus communis]|uniref:Paladin-like n=1 Tax=Pyrus ussuriensis x Pyrus communis TaxID=2448454 RepID=A0A5N5G9Z4_9ROSA|nr:paladin-like [Pyrus ussuriensis x Pyrus communis]